VPEFYMISLPTLVDPVKEIFGIFGCWDMYLPTIGPYPIKILTTPGGNPASFTRLPKYKLVKGVNSLGFNMTQLPAAKAGPTFQRLMSNG
jgi:hypothetical protein